MTTELTTQRWGIWHLQPEFPRVLFANQVYGIEFDDLAGRGIGFWVEHMRGKGWITATDIGDLLDAYMHLREAGEFRRG
jgi:hypothetical protein